MDTLIVILGPTGVGKTTLSISLANAFCCPIISADSRQIYREMRIGTATPSPEQLSAVRHYFIGTRSIHEPYSAGQYEADCLQLIDSLFAQQHKSGADNVLVDNVLVMVGGSMMYIDAICRGFDDIPTVDSAVREQVKADYEQHGLAYLQDELKKLDPEYYEQVDLQNRQRVMRAVEVCRQTGKPYSELRQGKKAERPFRIVKIGLDLPREQLYNRINSRVEQMIAAGLEQEARALYPYRELNSLNTVGYKELFDYFDGKYDFNEAVRLIKQDTRHYAKRQFTWFRADKEVRWFNAEEITIEDVKKLLYQ